ncbi:30S ribosomal protein S4 [Candidatus Peregrinibacteria bacterium RIFOXYC2_FULL_33_13]|nr:MAG: 30S ribosomal protein S4 [Candidatus Peregrinibacteria bacterium GW2011_GWA2_33_10]KKP39913.1 MAG: 30S ribosomal protein S4, small subunit ribosomal protein S4 [Candidatus Peregrinibacteria bacterium GW2011_GWC2_33_13]OGJ54316.1 MAG: 30S ribosomal protein S4 [Candidatus Peregrinibacteria bacterium RIFOXYC2_FULL_33_13]
MARYTGPKVKIFRREGINIFDANTSKFKAVVKKNYAPGVHGKNAFGKKSEFSKQLREKQKAKKVYGILERQFKKYYTEATKAQDITGDALMKICERRLDNVIYRAGMSKTRFHGRQMANHGIFKLNGKKVTIPSILLKQGDVLEARDKAKKHKYFEELSKKKVNIPRWLKVDKANLKIEIVGIPQSDDFEKTINSQLIIEYYSK